MVFHFKYNSTSIATRQKVFGRLIIYSFIFLIIVMAVDVFAQSTSLGWDLQESPIGTDFTDVTFLDSQNAWAIGSGGVIITTSDSGFSWISESSPVINDLKALDLVNDTIFAAGDSGTIIKKIIGGNWEDVSPTGAGSINFAALSIAQSNTPSNAVVYAAGNSGEVWKTSNGGTSWVQQSTQITEDIYDIDFLNSTWGLAVGTNGHIIGTLNGNSWSIRDQTPDLGSSILRGVKFKSSSRAYITGDNGLFMKSEISDNPIIGFVWNDWSNTSSNIQFNSIDASSQNKVWVVGNDGSIYLTKDGGNVFTKQKINDTIDANINAIAMVDGTVGYAVGDASLLLFTNREGIAKDEVPTVKDYSDFSVYWEDTKDLFFSGFVNMLKIIFFSMFLGFVLGMLLAVMKTTNSGILKIISTIYTDFFRNTPLLVQMLLIHFGLPDLGIDLTLGGIWERSFASSIIALGLNSAAYQAEIIRGGIQAIPTGQMEAGRSIGLTYGQSMRYVILPQAIRIVIPPLGNEFINMVLNSSLASLTGYQELARSARLINAFSFKIFQTWIITALFYFVITYALTHLLRYLEKRSKIPGLGFGDEN
ncbi:MAG: ABC transporter permease subunit [Candidatus Heimdallarchaeota archaeon]|nr:ABC transporter permease subunit [Candidatus Heimdallarchaeota archaeon]